MPIKSKYVELGTPYITDDLDICVKVSGDVDREFYFLRDFVPRIVLQYPTRFTGFKMTTTRNDGLAFVSFISVPIENNRMMKAVVTLDDLISEFDLQFTESIKKKAALESELQSAISELSKLLL